jgi:hypothetical protein
MNFIKEITDLIINASTVVGKPLTSSDFTIVYQPLMHIPLALPNNKMAIYTFVYNDEFLKIGQANVNSKARYQSHHYYTRSGRSTLANSLIDDSSMNSLVNTNNVNQWIKKNCERFDVIIDSKYGKYTLNFIEGLLHYKYNPRYEG